MAFQRSLTPEQIKSEITRLTQSIKSAKDVSYAEKELRRLLTLEGKTLSDVDITEEEIVQAKKDNCLSNIDLLKNGVDHYQVDSTKEYIDKALLELKPLGFSLEDAGLKEGELEFLVKAYHASYVKDSYLEPLKKNPSDFLFTELSVSMEKYGLKIEDLGSTQDELNEIGFRYGVYTLRHQVAQLKQLLQQDRLPVITVQCVNIIKKFVEDNREKGVTLETLNITQSELDDMEERAPRGIR